MTHSAWWFFLDALATYRLVVLVTRDLITEGLRSRIGAPWIIKATDRAGAQSHLTRPGTGMRYRLWQLSTCPWCVGVWVALGVLLLTRYWPQGWQYPAFLLALSGVVGFLEEHK